MLKPEQSVSRSTSAKRSLADARDGQELRVPDAGWTVVFDQVLDSSHGANAKPP
jgi:hypothetical protein